jgi:diadenosine tetraphosphate (Ap4A) HIT family hydrolase
MIPLNELPYDLDDAHDEGLAPWTETVRKDFHVAVFEDVYPVTKGHLLFVPQYATEALIENAFSDALTTGMKKVKSGEWEAFNIGMNFGEAAGQTVPWPHIHLIPRKVGDCADPTGGIRNVIPGQGTYQKTSYKKPITV